MVLDMERGARDVVDIRPSGFSEWPYGDYVRHECVRMRLMARGEGYASSRFLSVAEKTPASASVINQGSLDGVSVIVCAEDKGRRKDVLYFLPEMSLVFPGQCSWQGSFAEAYAGLGYMYQDWAKDGPDAATVLGNGAVWAYLADGVTPKPAARTKAFASAAQVAESISGKSAAELQAAGLTGTHVSRHLAEVVAWAHWGDTAKGAAQADVLGDWATQSGASADPAKHSAARRSARDSYTPNSTLKEQVEARTRFARMMQAAFENFGTGNVVATTTWPELFPDDPPPALAEFYGEQVVYGLHSVCANASLPGVAFAKTAPRPKRGLSAP